MTKDYEVTLEDSTGRRVTLYINGDNIDQMGGTRWAIEEVERNAFENAIAAGDIGPDAYLVQP
jgi:hypothetical protein